MDKFLILKILSNFLLIIKTFLMLKAYYFCISTLIIEYNLSDNKALSCQ